MRLVSFTFSFQNDTTYNNSNVYCDLDQPTLTYATAEKYGRRKHKLTNGVKKITKSKKSLQCDPDHSLEVGVLNYRLVKILKNIFIDL